MRTIDSEGDNLDKKYRMMVVVQHSPLHQVRSLMQPHLRGNACGKMGKGAALKPVAWILI